MMLTICLLILSVCGVNFALLCLILDRVSTKRATSPQTPTAPQSPVPAASNQYQSGNPDPLWIVDSQETERKRLAVQRQTVYANGYAPDIVIRSDSPMVEDVVVSRVIRE